MIGSSAFRRIIVVGSFPTDADADADAAAAGVGLVGALMREPSDEWAVSRRYVSLESLAKLTDAQPRQLAAAAG